MNRYELLVCEYCFKTDLEKCKCVILVKKKKCMSHSQYNNRGLHLALVLRLIELSDMQSQQTKLLNDINLSQHDRKKWWCCVKRNIKEKTFMSTDIILNVNFYLPDRLWNAHPTTTSPTLGGTRCSTSWRGTSKPRCRALTAGPSPGLLPALRTPARSTPWCRAHERSDPDTQQCCLIIHWSGTLSVSLVCWTGT